ncbi:hypothetical protein ADU60_16490 (plasmid) [Vibrio coralliilyticus]|nr:hypothetical protein ADU60_16490 [Vibrio coralliilyticus]
MSLKILGKYEIQKIGSWATFTSCKTRKSAIEKTASRKLKAKIVESNKLGDRKETTHEIRKKIENLLLEREQKKLWEL